MYGDFEFFTAEEFATMVYRRSPDSKCDSEFQPRSRALALLRHVTFSLVVAFLDIIIVFKLLEWHKALHTIQIENKMDEEIVKIALVD